MAEYNNDEKVFADGFSFKRQENAPDFVVGRLSVKCDEAVAFILFIISIIFFFIV